MPKKALGFLAVLAAIGSLVLVLSVAAPSFAIAQEEPLPDGLQAKPAPKDQDETIGNDLTVMPASTVVCSPQAGPQVASQEEVTELPTAANPESPTPGPEGGDMVDESFTITESGDSCNQYTDSGTVQDAPGGDVGLDPACAQCSMQVAKAAQEAITGDDTGPSPTETFGAALEAARNTGSSATREAAASEEAQQSPTPVEDTPAYQAAFEAAKEAGADEETAKEAAKQAVADLLPDEAVAETVGSASGESSTGEASNRDPSEGGSGEGIAATEGKTSKGAASKDDASEEETTDEEIVASGEDGGSGDAPTTPADSKAPLLIGGIALLSVGGFAGLRFARSWPSSSARGSRLLRD